MGRYAQRKSSDFETIPLCRRCHHMLHNERERFQRLYGNDFDLLPKVAQMLDRLPD